MKTVILDYGHGGLDENGTYTTAPSKQAFVDGEMVYEGVINRKIGDMVKSILESYEVEVKETVSPQDPTDRTLDDRIDYINSIDNAVLVSIHCNAFDGSAYGSEIWTTRGQNNSDKLADKIAKEFLELEAFGLKFRPDNSDGDLDKEAGFKVVLKSKHPSVLVECFFFDNIHDYKLYRDNFQFRVALAYAIADGTFAYIGNVS